MDINKHIKFKEKLKHDFCDVISHSCHSHETLFKYEFSDDKIERNIDLSCSLAYLTEAHTLINKMEMLILLSPDVLDERMEFDTFFQQFAFFNNEALECIRTDHSNQHTNIYFNSFIDSSKSVASLLDVEDYDNFLSLFLKQDD